MQDVVDALAAQHAELDGLLAGRSDEEWQQPSRCEGWTVADVVLHLVQTDAMARAAVQDRFPEFIAELTKDLGPATSVDDGAARMVERERGAPPPVLFERWQSGADELRRLLAQADPHHRVTWVAGELSTHTLASTRLAETWIHTGDVAAAFGVSPVATDQLRYVARLAWRTLPYAFAQAGRSLSGPVALELRGPDDQTWTFGTDAEPVTTVRGDALDWCLVAARRVEPRDTGLTGEGPDVDDVLRLARTYA